MPDDSSWPAMPRPAAVAATLATILLLSWLALRTDPLPQPLPTTAPPTVFSAARAFAHVQALAREPRPIASPGNAKARQYIIEQLRAAGLEPQVQTATVRKVSVDWLSNTDVTLGVVHNIVARLPGAARGHASRPLVLVTAHYDSGEDTLGAANGAASAAAMLEALRAFRQAPPPANDVLFVFTDGQHAGALGAMGFVNEHPLARQAGLVLQFDHIGNRGPLVLYDASHADSAAMRGWASATDHRGSSLMTEVYKVRYGTPGSEPLASLGVPMLHFAATQGSMGRDGAFDTPERLSQATLQHEGDTMLALLRHFGSAPLAHADKPAGEVFFSLPLAGGVHYPMTLLWPATRIACLLMFGVCCFAMQRTGACALDIVHATFGFSAASAALMFTAHVLWESMPALQHKYSLDLLSGGRDAHWYALAFASLAAGLFVALQRHLRRTVGTPTAAVGVLCYTAIALIVTSVLAPGASYVLALPLFAGQVAFAALFSRRVTAFANGRRLPILLAGLAPAVLLIAPAVRDMFVDFSPQRMLFTLALFAVLLGLALLLLAAVARRYLARALVLAGAGCLGIAHSAGVAEPELPQPNRMVYFKDTPSWRSVWIMPRGPLDDWTKNEVFPNTLHPYVLPYILGPASDPVWYAAAPRVDGIAYPKLLIEKVEDGHSRHVEFKLVSKNSAPKITMRVDGGGTRRTSVNGRLLTGAQTRGWSLTLYGMQDQTLDFSFDMKSTASFTLYVQEQIPGLPDNVLPPRPPGLKPALLPMTGKTIASDIVLFR